MPAEFMTVPTAAARTYPVPAAMVASLTEALADPQLSGHHDVDFAGRLATTGKASLDDVITVHTASDPDGARLRGGQPGREWADRIIDSYLRQHDQVQQAALDRHGYDPERYEYAGITDPDNEDLITSVVRIPVDSTDLTGAQALTASGWLPVEFDFTDEDAHTYGVGLDADLLAFTASALIDDDVSGVLLAYAQPLCFLDEQPLLAAAPAMDTAPAKKSPGFVYAIVDATDTSAVMDLILMNKTNGQPAIYRRNGGKWQLDPTLLDAFMSAAPPPIVELTGLHRNQIIAQVDASNANQVVDSPKDGQAELGPGATETKTKPTVKDPANAEADQNVDLNAAKAKPDEQTPGATPPPENREKRTPNDAEEGPNSRPPVTAAAAIHDSYTAAMADAVARHDARVGHASDVYYSDKGYQTGFSLTAALEQADTELQQDMMMAREMALLGLSDALSEARAYVASRDQVLIPVLAAGAKPKNAPTDNSSPGQMKAESLRKYWLKGKGAVKIRWGTSGDFTRCVRQLREHLGTRTEGYCARRHREANGFYPGDKRNK